VAAVDAAVPAALYGVVVPVPVHAGPGVPVVVVRVDVGVRVRDVLVRVPAVEEAPAAAVRIRDGVLTVVVVIEGAALVYPPYTRCTTHPEKAESAIARARILIMRVLTKSRPSQPMAGLHVRLI